MKRAQVRPAQYTATVRAADGVRFTAVALSAAERASQLVDYVRKRCDYTLWPEVADLVRALIYAGDAEGAIEVYFDNVGARWDEEWLELAINGRGETDVGLSFACARN